MTRDTTGDCKYHWGIEIQCGGLLETSREKENYKRFQGQLGTCITVQLTSRDFQRQERLQETAGTHGT